MLGLPSRSCSRATRARLQRRRLNATARVDSRMTQIHVFSDEAGCLTFKPPGRGVSRYFMIGTIASEDCAVGDSLLSLRRALAWKGVHLEQFHATNDKPHIRDRVFATIANSPLRYDVTILDKTRAFESVKAKGPLYFYQLAWYQHLKYVAPRIAKPSDELLVVASSLKIKGKKKVVHDAVKSVVNQVSTASVSHTAFVRTETDPCLQAADYLTWAVQRKYETGDSQAYDVIAHQVHTEFAPFS